MNKFIRWYNRNRKTFWLIIVISIIVINIPRVLNQYAKNNKKDVSSSINNTTTYDNKKYSIISEETIEDKKSTEFSNIIDEFIELCNNKNAEEAYKLISNECKEKIYPTLEDFINNYYNKIFENKKTYSIQLWVASGSHYTYKVNLKEDILASGNVNSASIEDYYTIVNEDNAYKLNINNYIGNEEIDKFKESTEVKITILSKDIFMEYEIYNIEIENKTRNSILLDLLEKTDNMYLEDEDNLHYYAYNHEMVKEELRVKGKKKISIKFNKKYSTERKIERIVFSDIILDYDTYKNFDNKDDFEDRTKIEIEL